MKFITDALDAVKSFLNLDEDKPTPVPFTSKQIMVMNKSGYPVYLAPEFVAATTNTKDMPSAFASDFEGHKEIYVNEEFLNLDPKFQDAILYHEEGHLAFANTYLPKDYVLWEMGLSNKAYLSECAADDYAVSCGADIVGLLEYLKTNYGDKIDLKMLDARLARLA